MFRIYLAGPLFSDSEREWLSRLKRRILDLAAECVLEAEVMWPGEFFDPEEIQTWGAQAKFEIFKRCLSSLDQADLVVALLDGAQVDDGTAFELGYCYHAHRDPNRIVGIRTDFRASGDCTDSCANAMIEGACSQIARSVTELQEILKNRFAHWNNRD